MTRLPWLDCFLAYQTLLYSRWTEGTSGDMPTGAEQCVTFHIRANLQKKKSYWYKYIRLSLKDWMTNSSKGWSQPKIAYRIFQSQLHFSLLILPHKGHLLKVTLIQEWDCYIEVLLYRELQIRPTIQSSYVSSELTFAPILAILDCDEFLPKVPLLDKTEAKTLLEAVAPLAGGGGGGGGSRLLLPWSESHKYSYRIPYHDLNSSFCRVIPLG